MAETKVPGTVVHETLLEAICESEDPIEQHQHVRKFLANKFEAFILEQDANRPLCRVLESYYSRLVK